MKYTKIYFVGIKGVGMATLALIAKEAGSIVAGSDVEEIFITDEILQKAGIHILNGFREENPVNFFGSTPVESCLLITTGAHEGFDNPEVSKIKEAGKIKVLTHGEAVGVFMNGEIFGRTDMEGISVSGSHGKTTIAGMIACALVKLNMDPSYSVGTSVILPIGAAGRYGSGKYFVAEADEYISEAKYDPTPKFLYQKPKYLIINNIDYDHPDVYPDIESVTLAFKDLIENIQDGGILIANGDDERIRELISGVKRFGIKIITYGTDGKNDFRILDFKQHELASSFRVMREEMELGEFALSIPGYHNAKNSLAVIALLMEIGVSVGNIAKVLPGFLGTARRFEKVGELEDGVLIFDDYAHHPEEIRKTLEAAKAAYPDRKITVVFQAHTFARTKALLPEFSSSFSGIDELIILPTFSSMRDANKVNLEEDRNFVESIRATQANVKLIETPSGVVEYLLQNVKGASRLIITMGAGDVYKIGHKLKTLR